MDGFPSPLKLVKTAQTGIIINDSTHGGESWSVAGAVLALCWLPGLLESAQ